MKEPLPNADARQRRALLGLAAMFFVPMAAAFLLYYGTSIRPHATANHGDLLTPARALPAISLPRLDGKPSEAGWLQGHWTFLYYGEGVCDTACQAALYQMRQVRLSLGRDITRVERVFLAGGDCCDGAFLAREHAGLVTLHATSAASPLVALLPVYNGAPALAAGRIYIIDPLGNVMLSYAPAAAGKGMLEDMKRLLKLSHIG
jgi:hypothetical protein